MITEIKDGKLMIMHPSGHVDIYDKQHLLRKKEQLEKRITMIQSDMAFLDELIRQL